MSADYTPEQRAAMLSVEDQLWRVRLAEQRERRTAEKADAARAKAERAQKRLETATRKLADERHRLAELHAALGVKP